MGVTLDYTGRDDLTAQETDILALLADGRQLSWIADELYLSISTIKFHRKKIYRKLRARNAPHAVALAIRSGLIE